VEGVVEGGGGISIPSTKSNIYPSNVDYSVTTPPFGVQQCLKKIILLHKLILFVMPPYISTKHPILKYLTNSSYLNNVTFPTLPFFLTINLLL
jgi:hypothetical protein